MSRGRDSLELASLASSSRSPTRRESLSSSSSAGGPPSSRNLSFDNEDPLTSSNGHADGGRPRQGSRTYSITSAFDFVPNVFPLSATNGYTALGAPSALDPSVAGEGQSLEKHKTLTYLNGLSLVIGLIIGSGIFSSPSQVNRNAGSPGASLVVWSVAGLLAWTGASSYAELGAAIPLNGGAQTYLTKIFGPLFGFLYSFFMALVLKPGSTALIAIIFGDYILRAVVGEEAGEVNAWISKAIAILGLVLVTAINALSTRLATRAADVFLLFKILALLAVLVIGIFVAVSGFSWDGAAASDDWRTHNWFEGSTLDLSQLAVALYAGLWAYDGWDNVNNVVGELVSPSRDLHRVVHTSMPVVIACYLLANVAYFLALPLAVTFSSSTIATAMGAQVLGKAGALLMALMVSSSCFGSLNASTFTSSRLFYAAAKEGYLPRIFGTLGVRGDAGSRLARRLRRDGQHGRDGTTTTTPLFATPLAALALNLGMTAAYVAVGTFSTLLTLYGVAGYFFYFQTVLGLLVLRVREPHLERPYRCWITTPIIFCCVSLFLLSRSIVAAPWTSLSVVPMVAAGSVLYAWKVRSRPPQSAARERGHENGQGRVGWQFWKRWGRS